MSLTGCKAVSVGRFPFHRGRGGTEVARNLLRRGPPFPASCPMKGDASRLGKRGARLTLSPKGVLCVFRGEKNRKKGRVCGIINTSPFHPRTNKFLHQIYRRTKCKFSRELEDCSNSPSYSFVLFFRKLAREVQSEKRNDDGSPGNGYTKEVITRVEYQVDEF